MRRTLALLVVLVPAVAAAQPAERVPGTLPPLPPIGLPLPRIGLPLPAIGLQPVGAPHHGHHESARDGRRARRDLHFVTRLIVVTPCAVVGCVPAAAEPAATFTPPAPIALPAVAEPQAPTGTLQLDVEPRRDLQVFVDGSYVGTADDVGGVLELEPGVHAIEFRAPGYEPFLLDVAIAAHRTIRYRGALRPLRQGVDSGAATPRPDASAAADHRTTFYLIPGCYLGDVPPQQARLPQHCDTTRVIAFDRLRSADSFGNGPSAASRIPDLSRD